MNITLEIIKRARGLIDEPSKWTKMAWARDIYGRSVPVHDKNAVCFCATGAIEKAAEDLRGHFVPGEVRGAIKIIMKAGGFSTSRTLPYYNDETSYEIILRAFDTAVALLEAKAVQEAE